MITRVKKNVSDYRRKIKYKRFYSQFISQGDLCFDIGANLGSRTEIFSNLKAKVISVEPVQKTYELLKKRFSKNHEVTPLQFAIGSAPGRKDIYVSDVHEVCTLNPLFIEKHTQQDGYQIAWQSKQETEIRTLDQLIDQYGIPDFCKIDIEGYELEALKGLSQLLPCMSFEYTVKLKLMALDCLKELSKFKALTFNFSPYEDMTFSFKEWQNPSEFYHYVQSLPIEIKTGDIYVTNRPDLRHRK